MGADSKDRLGNKLRDVEKAREDQYFAKQDQEAIDKMKNEASDSAARDASLGRCPKCGEPLAQRKIHEVTIDECGACGGIWLDKGEFEAIAARESEGFFGKILRASMS